MPTCFYLGNILGNGNCFPFRKIKRTTRQSLSLDCDVQKQNMVLFKDFAVMATYWGVGRSVPSLPIRTLYSPLIPEQRCHQSQAKMKLPLYYQMPLNVWVSHRTPKIYSFLYPDLKMHTCGTPMCSLPKCTSQVYSFYFYYYFFIPKSGCVEFTRLFFILYIINTFKNHTIPRFLSKKCIYQLLLCSLFYSTVLLFSLVLCDALDWAFRNMPRGPMPTATQVPTVLSCVYFKEGEVRYLIDTH